MSSQKLTESENLLDAGVIGSRLRAAREHLGFTQTEMAQALRHPDVTTAAAISRYENGQIPNPEILSRYKAVTAQTVDWFLFGDEGLGAPWPSDAERRKLEQAKRVIKEVKGECTKVLSESLAKLQEELEKEER